MISNGKRNLNKDSSMKHILLFIDYFVPTLLDALVLWIVFIIGFYLLKWQAIDSNVAAIIAAGLVVFTRIDLKLSVGKVERPPEMKV